MFEIAEIRPPKLKPKTDYGEKVHTRALTIQRQLREFLSRELIAARKEI